MPSTRKDALKSLAKLKAKNDELERVNAALTSEKADLASEKADLASKNADLASQNTDFFTENADLASQIADFRKKAIFGRLHKGIVSAAYNVILNGDCMFTNKSTDWGTILQKLHSEMSGQNHKVLNGTMNDALCKFREHTTFDKWALAWRMKQFVISSRMIISTKPLIMTSFIYTSCGENPGCDEKCVGALNDNPAFSTSHADMEILFNDYNNDLSGDLKLPSTSIPELSELTVDMLLSLKIYLNDCIREPMVDQPAGLTVKTFLEYIAFLIDVTDFTTPICPNSTELKIFESTKRTMENIDYPQLFINEQHERLSFQ